MAYGLKACSCHPLMWNTSLVTINKYPENATTNLAAIAKWNLKLLIISQFIII